MNDLLRLSSELQSIYKYMPEYLSLREEDQRFFDNLFILLLFNEDKVYSNKYLSQRFNIPVSTIEKRIKRITRAKLIRRTVSNEFTEGRWITTARALELDPFTFSQLMKELSTKSKSCKEDKVCQARTIALENKKEEPMLEAETIEEYSIRTGAVEVPEKEKSFAEMLEEIP